jgi:quercetin dioxygenase-like cupin family protein
VRSRHRLVLAGAASAALLAMSLVGPVVAQTEPAAECSSQNADGRCERVEDWRARRAELRDTLKSTRAEWKAFAAEYKAERRGAREELRDLRRAAMAERKTDRAELRAQRRAERKTDRAEQRAQRRSARQSALPAAIDDRFGGSASADGSGVVRAGLGLAEPGSAPGEQLGLWHYTIAAGAELAPHTHPGWQLARIVSGELEYTVDSGEGVLLRAGGTSEPMGPGTYLLRPGDGVIEDPQLVHHAANVSEAPVTIISATLFEAGQPTATVVEEPAAEEQAVTGGPAASG